MELQIMKEAAHVLQREEAANTGSTQAGGLAAAAQVRNHSDTT